MPKTPRYLITSRDERTWKFDRPVIFLGEWCRTYERRHIWQNMDAIVASPYGLGAAQKDADYTEARALQDKLFTLLCEALNQYHAVQHSEKFWRIVLGHWLRRYVDMMLNRFKTLEQCLQTHQISGVTVYSNDHYVLATQDSYSAIWASNDDRWNNALISRLIIFPGLISFPVEVIADVESGFFRFKALPNLKRTVLKWGYEQLGKLARYLARDTDAFIINTYLPAKESIKLEFALGQCPQFRTTTKFEVSDKYNPLQREVLIKQFVGESTSNLECFLYSMLFELLPICFLEGFSSLNKCVEEQSWPKSPKFIFTSNNFDTDELFKLWTASKVESGTKYFTGQHGNNYGTYRYFYPVIEEVTADKFLTWGWTDGLPQHTPAFIFKMTGIKAKHFNPKGNLLLIEDMYYDRIDTWDRSAEHLIYFSEQVEFTRALLEEPFSKLVVRAHSSYKYNNPYEKEIWGSVNAAIKFDPGNVNISDLIAQSRLVVHSYDSTGILETLSQNIPTLAFWQNGFDHLRESAKPFYQLLVDAGVVHFSPKSIAQKVNEIWDDVDGWWEQDDVQDARLKFIERYARIEPRPVPKLLTILTE